MLCQYPATFKSRAMKMSPLIRKSQAMIVTIFCQALEVRQITTSLSKITSTLRKRQLQPHHVVQTIRNLLWEYQSCDRTN
jgi:hypothetical protein